MFEPTRRDVILSAAGASVLGLSGPLRFLPSAHAAEARERGFYRYTVGDARCIALYDGIWRKKHDETFIRNADVAETRKALASGGLSPEFVQIEFTQTLIETGGRTVLIDPGTGGQWVPTAGRMMDHLKAAGVDPRSIDTILISHFHPDHIFGLMEKDTDAQVFPQAEIIVPEVEYAFWTDPSVFSKLPKDWHGLAARIQNTFPRWKNVTRAAADREVAPGIRSMAAYGHTPGHTAYHVGAGDAELIVAGDIAIVPALFVANPNWHVVFDADPALAETNRKRMFDRTIADKAVIAGYHFGFPNAGKVHRDGAGYVFEPFGA